MAKDEKKTKSEKEEEKRLHIEIVRQMLTLATSGFGLVAALAWNELVKHFVESYVKQYLPQGSQLLSLIIYAIVVTVLAVVATLQLSKLLKNLEKAERNNKK